MAKKVLIAPNAFKGTIEAKEAAGLIENLILQRNPNLNIDLAPIADGGDGTCDLLSDQLKLNQTEIWSLDPIGRPIEGRYSFDQSSKRAFLDVSTVSGIGLLNSSQLNPFVTSTYGTGLLIKDAIACGAKEIVLGLGGSATLDLGAGIIQALGATFLNEKGRSISSFAPDFLLKTKHIQLNKLFSKVKFTFLCDVKNPFFGKKGAIPVFGPQKGLKKSSFEKMEITCNSFLQILARKFDKEIHDSPGFGAAGGIAFGLSFLFPIDIQEGSTYFFQQTQLEKRIENCDLILTGEGKYDSQSSGGKGSFELLQLAKKNGKEVVLITSGKEGYHQGFDYVVELPSLDFTHPNFKKIAKENLINSLNHFFDTKVLIID